MLTVVTPADSQDLASLSTVKAALGITGSAEDETLPLLIKAASASISKACNRVFVEETVEETFRTERRDLVILTERYPVSDIVSMTENGTAIDSLGRELDAAAGCINRLAGNQIACFAQGTVVVHYVAGYPQDAVPPDLVQAAIMLVAHYRSTAGRDPLLRSESTTDIETLEYFIPTTAGLPAPVQALIDPHRKPAGA